MQLVGRLLVPSLYRSEGVADRWGEGSAALVSHARSGTTGAAIHQTGPGNTAQLFTSLLLFVDVGWRY